MAKLKNIISAVVLLLLLICQGSEALGYGYGLQGKDTLAAVYDDIRILMEKNDYAAIQKELERIEVPLVNFHQYFGINLKPLFLDAIARHDKEALLVNMEKLIYLAIREKINWNKKENLEKFLAARARFRVILQYYELFKSTIKSYDQKNHSAFNSEIVELLVGMSRCLGTAGSFGYNAQPAEPAEFSRLSRRLEEVLVIIFPHFEDGYKAVIKTH